MVTRKLHWRIALPAAVLVAVVFVLGISYSASRSAAVADQLLLQQGFNFTRNISVALVNNGLADNNVSALERVVRSLRLDGAHSVQIFSADGQMLVDGIRGANGGEVVRGREPPAIPSGEPSPRVINAPDHSYLLAILTGTSDDPVLWHPVTDKERQFIGWLRVHLDAGQISAALTEVRNSSLLILALGLLIVAAGSYLIMRRPMLEVERAAAFADALRPSGNRTVEGYPEVTQIDQLFQSLNRTALDLNTQSGELQHRKHFLETLANSLNEAIYATDQNGRTIFVNDGLVRLSGWSRDDLLDMDIWTALEVVNRNTQSLTTPPQTFVIDGGHNWSSDELRMRNRAHLSIPIEVLAAPLEMIDGSCGAVVVLIDHSAREQSNQMIEDAREAAEAANIAKSRFLNVIGHELRTPLNAILGMSQLALSKDPDAQVRRCLQVIADAGSLLRGLVENVIEYAAQDSAELADGNSFFLTELIDRAIHDISERASRKGITVRRDIATDLPRHLIGDVAALSRILSVFCDNAVKYTESGLITVRASGARVNGTVELRLEVEDTGTGIDQKGRELLFSEFTVMDPADDEQRSGLGLGLSLARRLAARLQGQLGVDSTPGQGSIFWLQCAVQCVEIETQPAAAAVEESQVEADGDAALTRNDRQAIAVINEISAMLENSEFTASRQIEAYRDLLEEISPADLQRMRHALRVFDFDDAQEALNNLRARAIDAEKALYTKALGFALADDQKTPENGGGQPSA